jgi:hypothetical protein
MKGGKIKKSPIEFVLLCFKLLIITINAKNRCSDWLSNSGFWNSIHLQLVLSESNLCMTILLRSMVKLQAAVEILSPPQSLILVRTVANLTGATPSASLQPANALNIRPRLAGKSQARLIKRAHLFTLPFERKKTIRPRQTRYWEYPARDGSPLVRVVRFDDGEGRWGAVKNLTGIKNAGVNASKISTNWLGSRN